MGNLMSSLGYLLNKHRADSKELMESVAGGTRAALCDNNLLQISCWDKNWAYIIVMKFGM